MRKAFSKSRGGNVTVIGALTLFPIAGLAGIALDYSNVVAAKANVQTIADLATLMSAKRYRSSLDATNAEDLAINVIEQQLATMAFDLTCEEPDFQIAEDGLGVSVEMSCTLPTQLMQVFSIEQMSFETSASAAWGIDALEVVFVLDMSGSMSPHLDDLKVAMESILDVLIPESGDPPVSDTRVAMLTFNSFLNAGSLFEAATGLTPERTYFVEDDYLDAYGNPVTVTRTRTINSTCVIERIGDYDFTDDAPDPTPAGEPAVTIPQSSIDAEVAPGGTVWADEFLSLSPFEHNPHGFVSAPYSAMIDNPNKQDKFFTNIPGTTCNSLGPLPLTNVRSDLDDYVDALYTGGFTAGHQGLAWGWYLLSEKWQDLLPVDSQPAPYDDANTFKALIFFTDGRMDTGYNFGFGTGDPQARAICDNIKADTNIKIFTIGYELAGSNLDLVNHCASDPAFAYAPDGAASLTAAFDEIVNALTNLRISA